MPQISNDQLPRLRDQNIEAIKAWVEELKHTGVDLQPELHPATYRNSDGEYILTGIAAAALFEDMEEADEICHKNGDTLKTFLQKAVA